MKLDKESLENDLKDILFKIGQESTLHKIDKENFILEIDYDKYVSEIFASIKSHEVF